MNGLRIATLAIVMACPAAAIADRLAEEPAHGAPAAHHHGSEATDHGDAVHGSETEDHGGVSHDSAAGEHGGEHHVGVGINFADFSYKDEHKDPPLLFALINFILLLGLLGWKAVPALKGFWGRKSDSIRDGLEEGARLRKAAEQKLAEYTQRIADVDAEVEALIADIRAEAKEERDRIASDAEAQAKATKAAAEERIAAEIAQARREIEREVVGKAVEAAEQILRDRVGGQDHQGLVQGFISNLDAPPAADQRSDV